MAGHRSRSLSALCAASRSGSATCGNLRHTSRTVITGATSVTARLPPERRRRKQGRHDKIMGELQIHERDKSMSPASKLVALIPRTEALGSKDREAASLLSRWHARSAGDHSAQLSSRGSDGLTARERDVLAMISQGCSNKRIARTLEISPETVKSHVKRIFLKLAVSTRTEAVIRAAVLGPCDFGSLA